MKFAILSMIVCWISCFFLQPPDKIFDIFFFFCATVWWNSRLFLRNCLTKFSIFLQDFLAKFFCAIFLRNFQYFFPGRGTTLILFCNQFLKSMIFFRDWLTKIDVCYRGFYRNSWYFYTIVWRNYQFFLRPIGKIRDFFPIDELSLWNFEKKKKRKNK